MHFKGAVALELPGHPDGSSLSTIEDYAIFVNNYIQKNSVKNPVLVGHSMGGAIAMEVALINQNLTGLVLVGTGARLRVHPELLSQIKENYEEAGRQIASLSVSPTCDPVITERIRNELLKMKPEVTYGDFTACNKFDRMNDVERITYKTQIIVGADDKLTPVKYAQYLHDQIRNSKLVIIPGAGHSVMLERYRLFNEALTAFLDSL